jgi:acetolactate synthase-1/2/3 large subunit
VGRNYPADLGLIGPVSEVVETMLSTAPATRSAEASPTIVRNRLEPSKTHALTTWQVVEVMNRVCPPDSIFSADMGEHLSMALHHLVVRAPGDFVTCLGFGAMGSGVAVPMGYQLGCPQRRAFAMVGDYGFLMHGTELSTAVQLKLRTTFVVINDSRLNMCHHGMLDRYQKTPNFGMQLVDFAMFAKSLGAEGLVVHTPAELEAALTQPIDGPLVLDIRVDPDVRLGGSQRNAALRQFTEQA